MRRRQVESGCVRHAPWVAFSEKWTCGLKVAVAVVSSFSCFEAGLKSSLFRVIKKKRQQVIARLRLHDADKARFGLITLSFIVILAFKLHICATKSFQSHWWPPGDQTLIAPFTLVQPNISMSPTKTLFFSFILAPAAALCWSGAKFLPGWCQLASPPSSKKTSSAGHARIAAQGTQKMCQWWPLIQIRCQNTPSSLRPPRYRLLHFHFSVSLTWIWALQQQQQRRRQCGARRRSLLPCVSLWFAQTTKHALLPSILEFHAHHCTRSIGHRTWCRRQRLTSVGFSPSSCSSASPTGRRQACRQNGNARTIPLAKRPPGTICASYPLLHLGALCKADRRVAIPACSLRGHGSRV